MVRGSPCRDVHDDDSDNDYIYDHDIDDDNYDGIDVKMIATLKVTMRDKPEIS